MTEDKRPFMCRLGWHSWYMDAAMFTHADRCDRCNKWRHPESGRMVEVEREAWEASPPNESMDDAKFRVAKALAEYRPRPVRAQ